MSTLQMTLPSLQPKPSLPAGLWKISQDHPVSCLARRANWSHELTIITQFIRLAQWLVLASSALHLLIRNSPANGPARILLTRIYRLLGELLRLARCWVKCDNDSRQYTPSGCPSLISEQVERLQMRTFQQDTVLHIVTERASSLQIAGGLTAQSAMRTLLSENQAIYRSTENELTEGIVSAMTECSFSQVSRDTLESCCP